MTLRSWRMTLTASVAALCFGGLAMTGCSKKDGLQTTTTTTSTTTTAAAGAASGDAVAGALSPATAGGATQVPGAVGGGGGNDLAQTAAVSPLANSNGTTPASPGVGTPGGVAPGAAASLGMPTTLGVAATNTNRAVAAGAAATNASARSAVTPVGGVLGSNGAGSAAGSVAAGPAVAPGAVASGAVASGAPPR